MRTVMTALGPIAEDQLGITLMHEHVYINLLPEYRDAGLLNDHDLMASELARFKDAGGSTIVELTPAELTAGAAPDPKGLFDGRPATGHPESGTRSVNHVLALQQLARETGVQLVLGTGHYRDPYLGGWMDRHDPREIAERLIADLTEGMAGTDVRAGIIGEIGADKWYVSAVEERSFRAAAHAQLATGAAVTTHAARWPVGLAQLDILVGEGVDPARTIVGHCDTVNLPEYHLAIAQRGAYVQFDAVQGRTAYDVRQRVGFVMNLVRAGHIDQILLSHDVCTRGHLHATGGCGYDYLLTGFRDELIAAGLDGDEVDQMMSANPRRALAA